jgi:hypothetical protein
MLASDTQRQQSLSGYEGTRRYVLVNDHMHKRAEMVVRVTGDPDGTKHFEIVSETGWKAAQKHVLRKMLESEEEASSPEARFKARLSLDNYEFQMVGIDEVVGASTRSMFLRNAKKNTCSGAEFGWTQKTMHWYGQMVIRRKTRPSGPRACTSHTRIKRTAPSGFLPQRIASRTLASSVRQL